MIGSFEYNGIKSIIYKLACRSIHRPVLPSIRPRMTQIYGKSGVIDYGGGDYETRQIVMHIAFIGKSFIELRSRAREIAKWLSSGAWAKLTINDEPDKYYLARVLTSINLETMQRLGQADITFECQPFACMAVDTGADPTWDEADFPWMTEIPWDMVESYQFAATGSTNYTFHNPGTQEIGCNSPQGSKLDIVITGSWNTLEVSMNGRTLEYTEAGSGMLVIDNVEMEAKLDGVNKLSKIDGDIDTFLSLVPGGNTIEIDGAVIDVTVTIDFTPMWL